MTLARSGCRSLVDTLGEPIDFDAERFQVWTHRECGRGQSARLEFASDDYGMAQGVFLDSLRPGWVPPPAMEG